jgi:hypothetical protein
MRKKGMKLKVYLHDKKQKSRNKITIFKLQYVLKLGQYKYEIHYVGTLSFVFYVLNQLSFQNLNLYYLQMILLLFHNQKMLTFPAAYMI